jgi:broad specificity phosphatase PhoE
MKVYFVTHSTSTDNEAGLASGWNNPELSETGIQQAKELGNRFRDIRIDLACSSDLVRAVETVFIAFGEHFPLIVDRRLREINYGDYNGKPTGIVEPMKKNRISEPFPTGESYEQATARVHSFCRELKADHSSKTIIIVGHSATKFALDTLTDKRTLEECLSTPFEWQPYWEYEL